MELLVAFLITFGVVSTEDAKSISKDDATAIVKKTNLAEEAIIWGAEADDF
jgi:hypothetical protein